MALRVNPGGTLDPSQVYDRTALIARLWRTLENQSVYLTAERRMGKTIVVNKMLAAPPDGVQVVSCDLEKVGNPAQLVEELLLAISDKLPHLLRARSWLAQGLKALGIAKLSVAAIGSVEFRQAVEPHWEAALDRVLRSLERVHSTLVVVFLDEVAYGLDSVARATSTAEARAILDHFRAVRQTVSGVRFVYTSSVGLHHVIDALGADAGSWAPINDMAVVDVGPFSYEDAVGLASSLSRVSSCRRRTRHGWPTRSQPLPRAFPTGCTTSSEACATLAGRTIPMPSRRSCGPAWRTPTTVGASITTSSGSTTITETTPPWSPTCWISSRPPGRSISTDCGVSFVVAGRSTSATGSGCDG